MRIFTHCPSLQNTEEHAQAFIKREFWSSIQRRAPTLQPGSRWSLPVNSTSSYRWEETVNASGACCKGTQNPHLPAPDAQTHHSHLLHPGVEEGGGLNNFGCKHIAYIYMYIYIYICYPPSCTYHVHALCPCWKVPGNSERLCSRFSSSPGLTVHDFFRITL